MPAVFATVLGLFALGLLPSVAALADYIARANTGPDLDVVGYGASLWARNAEAAKVTSAVRAGGSSPHVTRSVSVSFRSRTVDEDADVIRRTPEILVVIGETGSVRRARTGRPPTPASRRCPRPRPARSRSPTR
ncbi:hypothetical protein [Streptomyces sp. wa22]|uniref:hypothetical protein n=1 Tax=Streptomyces sp. wa22 TaxID=1828244 RepID=UPI0021C5BC99|nr:hypothetical protein [Streptomyces sp. wa22]